MLCLEAVCLGLLYLENYHSDTLVERFKETYPDIIQLTATHHPDYFHDATLYTLFTGSSTPCLHLAVPVKLAPKKKSLFGYPFLPFERDPAVITQESFDALVQVEQEDEVEQVPDIRRGDSAKNEESKANIATKIQDVVKGHVDTIKQRIDEINIKDQLGSINQGLATKAEAYTKFFKRALGGSTE